MHFLDWYKIPVLLLWSVGFYRFIKLLSRAKHSICVQFLESIFQNISVSEKFAGIILPVIFDFVKVPIPTYSPQGCSISNPFFYGYESKHISSEHPKSVNILVDSLQPDMYLQTRLIYFNKLEFHIYRYLLLKYMA